MKIFIKLMNTNTSPCSWKVKEDEKDNNKEEKEDIFYKIIFCIFASYLPLIYYTPTCLTLTVGLKL